MSEEAGPKSVTTQIIEKLARLNPNKISFWETMSVVAFLIGFLTIVAFALPFGPNSWRRFSTLFAVGLGAWMLGGALGFLFGVPRYKSAPASQTAAQPTPAEQALLAYTPNSNLEQISDWLTKIIVGATLVQVNTIQANFVALCEWTAVKTARSEAGIFVGGIIVFFLFAGFLWGYLWCSIRIYREMVALTIELKKDQQ